LYREERNNLESVGAIPRRAIMSNKNPMIRYSDIITENMKNTFNVRDELKNLTVPEIKVIHDSDRLPFDVCFFNVEGDLNLSVGIRSASLLGARRVFVFGRKKFDNRGLVGTDKYIDIISVPGLKKDGVMIDINAFEEMCQNFHLDPWLVEHDGRYVDDVDWKLENRLQRPGNCLCLVFGNESNGLPKDLLDLDYPRTSIPQYGVMRSFNVSAAASIVMYEVSKTLRNS
jgi:tRNA G18 (ribose-2'-O)-methylase SpoU